MEDVNYLLFRRHEAQVRADCAASPESRAAHLGLVALYTDQMEAVRDRNRLIARANRS